MLGRFDARGGNVIKPFAILAAVHLAIRRHFATLGWAVVAGITLLVVPIVIFGPHD